ncbi:uncharacterized protein LOC105844475 [Hydra vulgaris]|uniref:Uncharacterized protein LOC105844475 n=1 Tax=Hydra vulgaris TaxID=6087 RepID=A0ABM4CPK5_HYDVU
MNTERLHYIFKFPRTRHLFDAGSNSVSRDDLVLSKKECEAFLKNQKLIIEEKVDGANIGISIRKDLSIAIQNRSHYVFSNTHKQFNVIDSWIDKHSKILHSILEPERHILFGEWLYAKHSIHYKYLSDYFMAFDIYDQINKVFLSVEERNNLLENTEIPHVRKIAEGINFDTVKIMDMLDTKSSYYDGYVEGLVIRKPIEERMLEKDYFTNRVKVVRPDFMQAIEEQWTKQKFTKNQLSYY